ncbi:3D domain-containing protein [Paenibacillus sp. 481]|uniref:3D domain-containing protein n=1 Tax=Paenibacillus sp. 481 TaxID=2835869 RepID=UPI001E48AF81|nr:3D domain-containing protein [Paenibacillus sp. 481]UHA73594.1 LysM peptidoglycan-binding domain-containing protein [Paenibacillus sp. 481]
MKKITFLKLAIAVLGLAAVVQILPVYADGENYVVQEGETFYAIANKYDLGLEAVLAANPNIDPKNVYSGLKVNLPFAADTASNEKQPKESKEQAEQQTGDNKNEGSKAQPKAQTKAPSKAQPKAAVATMKAKSTSNKIVQVSGREMEYKWRANMKATAYSADPSENGPWGGVDYFGNKLELGTVAVDPDVIPLGTKLFITGYDFKHLPGGGLLATARDIGGAINGNKIDIFVPVSKRVGNTFGIQNVQVYVLK